MFIEQPAAYLRWLYPKALWRINRREHAVYLTFDDGPIPESTPFILDTLAHYGVKATFFVVGDNVRKYPQLYERILAEGHHVGNHTYNHISGFRHTLYKYLSNVNKADALIHSRLMRPPHGWMRLSQYALLSRKYKVVMWDVVTRDYSRLLDADDVVNNVRRYARNGSIITFHDSLKSIDKLQTALPQSIEFLLSEGYELRLIPYPQT